MTKKAGYAAIIGKPNSGKSTLMNSILNYKLSIVSPKVQTTRKRVLGIYTSEKTQIIFIDTPGILKSMHKLHDAMISGIYKSIDETDVIILLIDLDKFAGFNNYFTDKFINALKKTKKTIIAVLNKTDLLHDKKELLPLIQELSKLDFINEVIPISGLKNDGINNLLSTIEKYIPQNDFYFDPEILSTQPQRFFVSEIIREHILNLYSKEIPYSTEVQITEFIERNEGKWFISAEIIIEKQSQKGIIIGAGGKKIKQLGEKARVDIEKQLQSEIYLDLFVKVRENWRKKSVFLKSFGY
jgi:GTPase